MASEHVSHETARCRAEVSAKEAQHAHVPLAEVLKVEPRLLLSVANVALVDLGWLTPSTVPHNELGFIPYAPACLQPPVAEVVVFGRGFEAFIEAANGR